MLISRLLRLVVPVVGESPCNPLADANCFAINKALGAEVFVSLDRNLSSFRTNDIISPNGAGVELTIARRLDNPSIVSEFYILFGKVEAEIRAARGVGVITSLYLQSDDLDEIDVELFGGNPLQFQTNFFIKGNTTTWDRGGFHDILADPFESYSKFAIEWTSERINWWINDRLVRFVDKNNPYGIPQSPMAVKLSLWAGGDPSNEQGTIDWAGGLTDYAQLPFKMAVKNVYIQDYSSGQYYYYGHRNGEWTDLTISTDGDISGLRPTSITNRSEHKIAKKSSSASRTTAAVLVTVVTGLLVACL